MIKILKNFFQKGFEDIYEVFIKPFMELSFYKKSFVLIVCGLLLYVPYINLINASHDEQYTMLMNRFSVAEMIRIIASEDGHLPFSYLYAKFWCVLFGGDAYNILPMRIATLFTFLMLALLGVFPVRRLLGDKMALVFIASVFLLPSAYFLAMNMRMYPLAVFLITGTFVYAMLMVYKPKKFDWLFFGVFSILSLYTHYYAAILTVVIWGVVFVDLIRLKKYQTLKKFFLGGVFISLLYTPWLFAFMQQYENMKANWFPTMNHLFYSIKGGFMIYESLIEVYYLFAEFFGILCWLLIFEFLIDKDKKNIIHMVVKRAVWVFWSIYIISILSSVFFRPNLVAKYLSIPVGLLYLSVAVAFVHFKKYRTMFLLFLFPVFLVGYSEFYYKANDEKLGEMKKFIEENMSEDTLVLYDHTWGHINMMFYGKDVKLYSTLYESYLVLYKDEVVKEEDNIKNLNKYKDIYHLSILWWDNEYAKCDISFAEMYNGRFYCFNKIDVKQAEKLIDKQKYFRILSLGNVKKD
ncbi:MAG: hypothetical protein IJ019_04660 [Alphaproteobacteria bacterium]|nr:hypothetical protein [Alphaproteobacteria bacterium]